MHFLRISVALPLLAGMVVAQATNAPEQPRLQLRDAIAEVVANNPALSSDRYMVEAQRRRVPQAKSLADPTVSVGWMGDAVPFKVQEGDPSSYRSISAMQEVPLGGKRKLRGQMAEKEVAAGLASIDVTTRRLITETKASFYDYYYFGKALAITQRNRSALQQINQITEARYRVGKVMQQDVLRGQVELSMLQERIAMFEQQRDTARARLNVLMNRDPEAELASAADIVAGELPAQLASLYSALDAGSPELARETAMIERTRIAVSLARQEKIPDLGVGYMFQQRPMMPDMHGLTFTINLPIFAGSKQDQMVAERRQELRAGEEARNNLRNELRFEIKQRVLEAQTARRLMELYHKVLMPQTGLTLESSRAAYQVGGVDFQTVISNYTSLYGYELQYTRQLADYQIALARLEALTGMELTGTAAARKEEK